MNLRPGKRFFAVLAAAAVVCVVLLVWILVQGFRTQDIAGNFSRILSNTYEQGERTAGFLVP